MLSPKRVKFRKMFKGRMTGLAHRGSEMSFGTYGLQALEPGWITSRQIEAARVALTRHIKRGGKVWIRIFPDKPITKKPAETRMGKGKGSPEMWVAVVKPGRVMFELEGVTPRDRAEGDGARRGQDAGEDQVRGARGGAHRCELNEIREMAIDDIAARIAELEEERFRLKFRERDRAARGSAAAARDPQGHRAAQDGAARARARERALSARTNDQWLTRPNEQRAPTRHARKTRTGPRRERQDAEDGGGGDRASRAAPGLRQDGDAHEARESARRGELGQDRRHGADRGDAPAVEGQAVARGRDRRARTLTGDRPMIQQESMVKVADNSGAKTAPGDPRPRRNAPALCRPWRHRDRGREERAAERHGEEVRRRARGGRAHGEGDAAEGRQLHPLRRERRRDHQRRRASRGRRVSSARSRASCARSST